MNGSRSGKEGMIWLSVMPFQKKIDGLKFCFMTKLERDGLRSYYGIRRDRLSSLSLSALVELELSEHPYCGKRAPPFLLQRTLVRDGEHPYRGNLKETELPWGGLPRAPPPGRPHRRAHTRAQPSRGSEPRARHTCPPASKFRRRRAAAVALSVERSAPMEPAGHATAAVAAPVDLSRSAAPAGLSAPCLNGPVPAAALSAPALSAGLTTPAGLAGAGLSLLPSLYGRAAGAGDYGVPASSGGDATECRLVEYRGERAFELFLKHLVGGLHTVYTKLKRLGISPIVCNVEQVRILRGLGAIQPGVNRCKLLACRDFDALYRDCTTAR
ncbi:hypothetical protein MTO96_014262 [Rhipicephalus appendiculatus]